MRLAMLEIKIALMRILRPFRFAVSSETQVSSATRCPQRWCIVERRDGKFEDILSELPGFKTPPVIS